MDDGVVGDAVDCRCGNPRQHISGVEHQRFRGVGQGLDLANHLEQDRVLAGQISRAVGEAPPTTTDECDGVIGDSECVTGDHRVEVVLLERAAMPPGDRAEILGREGDLVGLDANAHETGGPRSGQRLAEAVPIVFDRDAHTAERQTRGSSHRLRPRRSGAGMRRPVPL